MAHQQHLKAERNRRYKAKLQQEKLDGKGQRLQAYKDRRNLQKTRSFGNYALLAAPTAAAIKRLAIGKDHVDKQYAAMQAAHSEWSRLVQREPELSAVCAELPDLLRNCGKTFYHQHSQVLQWFRQPGDCLAANCRTELNTYDTKKYPQRITRY